ncbi:hypothetical protein LTR94_016543 [Friedmanniomyces endolithicus]|nr:hypothetical protein LTR94_016543 [Friedmanniomyces endolithicus]
MSDDSQVRRVPTALVIAVVVQTIGGLVWAGGAAARIATLEQRVSEQRLVAERLARLETQGEATAAAVERIERRLEGGGQARLRSPLAPRHSPLLIQGYASLWGVADLNGDVVQAGAFADSLAKTGAEGVRMLNQHDGRAPVGVWDEVREDERGLFVRGRIEDWSPEARFAAALSRAGAMDGLSIGYRTARARRQGRLRVLSGVELWEVSLVTFPMLPGARFNLA